jgi:hypothetical protein
MTTVGHGLPNVSRRTLFRFVLAAPLASGLIAAPTLRTDAASTPVGPRVRQRSLRPEMFSRVAAELHGAQAGSLRADAHALSTGPLPADAFRLAALTWAGPAAASFVVRTRSVGGRWSGWTRLRPDGHGPDPDTAEARRARPGTDALLVAESSAVEVRIESRAAVPDDLRLELIHPGTSAADAGRGANGPGTAAAATILRRADWGADESVRESGNPRYGEVRGAFVHHTAGSNSYTAEDVPGIIRSIYAYHVNGRGWRDIGYNFLVDKFGRIWEGRFGGIDRPVVGAHVAGYNSYAFGASVLGTYVNTEPDDAALRAFAQVIRWKFDVHNVDPTKVSYPGLKDVPAIAGHRDGGATQCPGDRLYAKLGTIRGAVANPVAEQAAEVTLGAFTAAARAGKQVWFTIGWSAGDEPVSGWVVLQRLAGDTWVDVRGATVMDGTGVTFDFPHSDQTYRVRTVAVTGAAGTAGEASASVALAVPAAESDLTMSQSGPAANGEIPIRIDWWHGPHGVTGEVELQHFEDGEWIVARTDDVTEGSGATVLQPSHTQVYRLRARSASSPQGVEISHPAGTSNEFRAIA